MHSFDQIDAEHQREPRSTSHCQSQNFTMNASINALNTPLHITPVSVKGKINTSYTMFGNIHPLISSFDHYENGNIFFL